MRIEQRNIYGKDVNMCVLTGNDPPSLNKYFATDIFKKYAEIAESTLVEYFLSAFEGKIIDRLFELARESNFLPVNIKNMRNLLNKLAYNNPSMQEKIPNETKWNEIIETYKKTENEITAGRVEIIKFDGEINSSIKTVTNIFASRFIKKSTLKDKIVSCDLNTVASKLRSYDFKLVSMHISNFNNACETLGINLLDNPINKLHLCAAYLSALERHETASDFSSWALPVLRNQEETKKVVINGFSRKNFYNFLKTHDINRIDFNAIFNSLAHPTIAQSDPMYFETNGASSSNIETFNNSGFIDKQLLNAIDLQSNEAKVDAISSYLTKNREVLYAYLNPLAEIRDNHIAAQIDFLINLPNPIQNAIYDTIKNLIDMTYSPSAQSSVNTNIIDEQLPDETNESFFYIEVGAIVTDLINVGIENAVLNALLYQQLDSPNNQVQQAVNYINSLTNPQRDAVIDTLKNICEENTLTNEAQNQQQLIAQSDSIDGQPSVNTNTVNGPLPGITYMPISIYAQPYGNSTDNVLTYEEIMNFAIMSQNQRYNQGFNSSFN